MKKIDGYDNAMENQGGEFERLPAGGYVCGIRSVTDFPGKQYLKIEFDILEGQYRGWYTGIFKRTTSWYGNFIRSYKDSAAGFFKGFITAIKESNPGYAWEWQEQTLVNKKIGLVLAYEEYINQKDQKKERMYVYQTRSADAIRRDDFEAPELKKLKLENGSGGWVPPTDPSTPANMQETDKPMPF
jgi:hypothetical protein